MKIQAAIFDMDGTLVDSVGFWDTVWEKIFKKYLNGNLLAPSEEDTKRMRTMIMPDAMEMMHRHYGLGESAAALLEEVNAIVEDFYKTEVRLKPGVAELLAAYEKRGVKMCLASASPMSWIQSAVDHCGIRGYFSHILSCLDLGCGKDRPDIYLLALERLGTAPNETWVFEDSLTALRTAEKIGLPTVGVYDARTPLQEKICAVSTEYIAPGEDFTKCI